MPKQEVPVPATLGVGSAPKECSTPTEAHPQDNTSQVISKWIVDDATVTSAQPQSNNGDITVTMSTGLQPAPDYEHSNVDPIRTVEVSTEQRSQRDIDEANFAKISDDVLISLISLGDTVAGICESYKLPVKYRQRLYKRIESLRSEGVSLPELKRGRRDTSSAPEDQLSEVD